MKIYLSRINESWIVDRIRNEWYSSNRKISTKFLSKSDIVWIVSPWLWKNVPKRFLEEKKVVCSHYHFDFENFDKKNFLELDKFVDEYHVISKKTKNDLEQLTDKKITSIPFWINQKLFYEIEDKKSLLQKYGFNKDEYLIGSFQRDTEGHDLTTPKLIKGPDIFIEILDSQYKKNNNTTVVLTGKRRNYIINELERLNIRYKYFEMINFENLNELYNILDLYLVTSRIEGGPQAILECAITKTPVLSSNVGVASEILHPESIYDLKTFDKAKTNINYAYDNSLKYTIPLGMDSFVKMFKELYES